MNELTEQQRAAFLRWRLILGKGAEGAAGGVFRLDNLCPGGAQTTAGEGPEQTEAGSQSPGLRDRHGLPLTAAMLVGVDEALAFIYEGGPKGASLNGSAPYVPRQLAEWLQNIRKFFPTDTVALIQKDAIVKKDLKSLLFEPETMPLLEKNIDLVATLLQYQKLIPDRAKDVARELVREIVDEIKKKLENEVRQAIVGALKRNRHSVMPIYRNIDWKTTVRRNLKNYQPELAAIIPERFYFWSNQVKFHEWQMIVAVDQSGSMGTSIIYSAIMAAIFASINVLKTHLLFFNTEIADMTPHLTDPADVIFGARLGGGTDIAKAVTYAADLVEQPEKTIFLLITDLYEGGNPEMLLGKLAELVESKVKTICLLALSDDGRAAYHHDMARDVTALGVQTFGCTPKKLITVIERIMKGQNIEDFVTA